MSREIKFRAWETYKETMHSNVQSGVYEDPDEIIPFNRILELASYEVMQYIGKKDKNNKEIYEGDIVNAELHDIVPKGKKWVTETKIEKFFVEYDQKDTGFRFKDTDNLVWLMQYTVLEVIGNIYENPELLEGEK